MNMWTSSFAASKASEAKTCFRGGVNLIKDFVSSLIKNYIDIDGKIFWTLG